MTFNKVLASIVMILACFMCTITSVQAAEQVNVVKNIGLYSWKNNTWELMETDKEMGNAQAITVTWEQGDQELKADDYFTFTLPANFFLTQKDIENSITMYCKDDKETEVGYVTISSLLEDKKSVYNIGYYEVTAVFNENIELFSNSAGVFEFQGMLLTASRYDTQVSYNIFVNNASIASVSIQPAVKPLPEIPDLEERLKIARQNRITDLTNLNKE